MSERVRPQLQFETLDDVIDDVRRMRRVGYEKHGNWSLPQIAWHLNYIMKPTIKSPANRTATPEQTARWNGFLAAIREPGGASKFPANNRAPDESRSEADVDHFLAMLTKLRDFPDTMLEAGPLGAIPIEQGREAHQLHAAHHLGFLKPKAERRSGLTFADFDAAIADIRLLQKGFVQIGEWTLAQNCFHINAVTQGRLKPPPFASDNEEQKGRAAMLQQIFATGRIPRIVAPDFAVPPPQVGDEAIEACVATFQRCKTHTNFSPHRLFGTMSDADSRRHILIHAAHHLSLLVHS